MALKVGWKLEAWRKFCMGLAKKLAERHQLRDA
jgi:hypothetical protein